MTKCSPASAKPTSGSVNTPGHPATSAAIVKKLLYQETQRVVAQMVRDRRGATGGGRLFGAVWTDTGLVCEKGRGRLVTRMWAKGMRPVRVARAKAAAQEEAEVPEGLLEMYTDGSGGGEDSGAHAGWGFVAVQQEHEVDARCGVVVIDACDERWEGAERGTNNTAEVTAVMRALGWAADRGETEVCIRYDSE